MIKISNILLIIMMITFAVLMICGTFLCIIMAYKIAKDILGEKDK